MEKARIDDYHRPAFLAGLNSETGSEVRLFVGLDASTSMDWHEKYRLIARQYPAILHTLKETHPEARVETWLFNRQLLCFSPLARLDEAKTPTVDDYARLIDGGSAITDCLVTLLERANQATADSGPAPTRVILWTDGWNRLSDYTPEQARRIRKQSPDIDVHLIGLISRECRWHFQAFIQELALDDESIFLFQHDDNLIDTQECLTESARQLLLSMTMGGGSKLLH